MDNRKKIESTFFKMKPEECFVEHMKKVCKKEEENFGINCSKT